MKNSARRSAPCLHRPASHYTVKEMIMRLNYCLSLVLLLLLTAGGPSMKALSSIEKAPPGQATKETPPTTKKRSPNSKKWIRFKGTAQENGQTYLLRALTKSGGVIEMAKEHVKVKGKTVMVENNVDAKVVEAPKPLVMNTARANSSVSASDCHRQDDCPSKCCACIGLVRVCCGEGGTRGVCLGAWGCP
jgi:hypothetical protein